MTTILASTKDIIEAFFARFGAGDADGVLELFADEVDFNVAGAYFVPWTGPRTDKAGVSEFLTAAAAVEPQEFVVEQILADGGAGVALGHFTHRVLATGKTFSSRFALHVTVEDGLISRYHMFEDSYAIAEAFRD
jgi:ketosteroid isomerase-like protein